MDSMIEIEGMTFSCERICIPVALLKGEENFDLSFLNDGETIIPRGQQVPRNKGEAFPSPEENNDPPFVDSEDLVMACWHDVEIQAALETLNVSGFSRKEQMDLVRDTMKFLVSRADVMREAKAASPEATIENPAAL